MVNCQGSFTETWKVYTWTEDRLSNGSIECEIGWTGLVASGIRKIPWITPCSLRRPLTYTYVGYTFTGVGGRGGWYFNFRIMKDRPCTNEIIRTIPIKDSKVFFRFLCANFALPVYPHLQSLFDSGRCHLCNSDRGSEFHYLLVCQKVIEKPIYM